MVVYNRPLGSGASSHEKVITIHNVSKQYRWNCRMSDPQAVSF